MNDGYGWAFIVLLAEAIGFFLQDETRYMAKDRAGIQDKIEQKSKLKSGLRTRDLIALLSIVVSLVLVIACIVYIDEQASKAKITDKEKVLGTALQDMPDPDLEQVPVLPSIEDMSQFKEQVDWVINNPAELSARLNGYSTTSFAWLRKQLELDSAQGPLPQYFSVQDIIIDGLAFGTPTVVSGLLLNTRTVTVKDSDEQWQWMVIEAQDHQFIMLLVPGHVQDYTIGNPVKIVARSMGLMKIPGHEDHWMPLLGARNVYEPKETDNEPDFGVISPTPDLSTVNESELFTTIDDERTVLELRPYFYLLGKINLIDSYDENVYENAVSANPISGKMHDNPSAYRGQVFTVRGRVLDVFTDDLVKRQKPYNIEKVSRVLLWALVKEKYQEQNTYTGEISEKITHVRHTYELAVIGDVGELSVGQIVEATGRFLKVHGIPMDRSSNRDRVFGKLQSDNFYSKMFVVPSLSIIPEAEENLWVKITLAVILASFFLCVLWLYAIDIRNSEKYRKRSKRRMSKSAQEKESDAGDNTAADNEADSADKDSAG